MFNKIKYFLLKRSLKYAFITLWQNVFMNICVVGGEYLKIVQLVL